MADRFKRARGINKEESPIFSIVIIHHKPHNGIGGGHLPGRWNTHSVWLTLIQNAAAAA